MWHKIRDVVSNNMGLALMLAFVLGLSTSAGSYVPTDVIPYLLGVIIFFACSKITQEDLAHISLREISGFYVLRFSAVPVVVFYVASFLLPEYKFALLMLALLPCGATLPAVSAIFGGNAALGLGAVVLSSFAAPFVLPAVFGMLSGEEINVDALGMFLMLSVVIFVPAIAYFGSIRLRPSVRAPLRANSSFMAVVLIGIVAFVIISSQREYILADAWFAVQTVFVGIGFYAAMYGFAWFLFARKPHKERISYALMSGNNNIALGISLAFLYLPIAETSMLVIWELSWLSVLSGFQFILFRNSKRKA